MTSKPLSCLVIYIYLLLDRTLTKLGVPLSDTGRGGRRYEDYTSTDEEDMEGLLSRP